VTSRADILYVANIDNSTIEKFSSGGGGSVFASTGLREYGQILDYSERVARPGARAVSGPVGMCVLRDLKKVPIPRASSAVRPYFPTAIRRRDGDVKRE
jgi:hypothetical protein